jgi:hypothetical protein
MAKGKQTMVKQDPSTLETPGYEKDNVSLYKEKPTTDRDVEHEYEVKLESHKPVVVEHAGVMKVENIIGGDIKVNDSILYTGDSIDVENKAILFSECFPKVKITKYR